MKSTLRNMNQVLTRRKRDLGAANRKLKAEIAKRKDVENTLRASEAHAFTLLDQSERLQEELRQLSRGILLAQEEERKRISRELHDVIAQVLAGINVRLALLKKDATVNTKGLSRNIARAQKLVEKSVAIVHRFACDLRPAVVDDLGLIPALHSFMKNFMRETGVRVHLSTFAELDRLHSTKRIALYRVAQEALSNVARHAQAARADVKIHRHDNSVRMDISDDGKGFDVNRVLHDRRSKRLGLLGIRERVEMVGGRFNVESVPGKGTTLRVEIPFACAVKRQKRTL